MKKLSSIYTPLLFILFLISNTLISAQNEGVLTIRTSEKIKQIVTKKKDFNKNIKKINGFKIQLFYGEEKGAYAIRDNFSSIFPHTSVEIKHANPEWKVWAGAYKTRLEADRALKEIREAQFNAFVFKTEIKI